MALFILLQNAKHAETPNSLFLYFAENSKHCIWRIREVILVFTTSSEKKHWLDILEMAVSRNFFFSFLVNFIGILAASCYKVAELVIIFLGIYFEIYSGVVLYEFFLFFRCSTVKNK